MVRHLLAGRVIIAVCGNHFNAQALQRQMVVVCRNACHFNGQR